MNSKCMDMSFHEIFDTVYEALKLPFKNFVNPTKRIHYLYLVSTLVLALYVYYRSKTRQNFFKFLFHKKVWFSKSAWIDYKIIFFNSFVKVLLIAPFLIFGLYISYHVNEYLMRTFGYESIKLSVTETLIYYTIALTIIGDFFSFFIHYLMHRIPFLWEFHKIHHSATSLNPLTQYRLHPIELLLNNAKNIIVFGVVTGVFDYLSNHQIEKITFLGVNAFSFIFLAWGANLRHSHVKLTYFNFLEYIFISPFQHQIHHSNNPEHFDKNMGSKLAIWDWMFGTLIRSKSVKNRKVEFGLGLGDDKNYNTFWKNILMPFYNLFQKVTKSFKYKKETAFTKE
ncbi:sterol desaturase family protein [Aureivirga marina]|uniref:sterol desaturase family protein n=1 Tax=Aureivirga marina TaxID=1182451 RepID=UPI0018C97918|nr:sterol desaturase family protein [Aureivirga marina]